MITALAIFLITYVFIGLRQIPRLRIVAQQAGRRVQIGFMEYFRVGALITLVTVAVGILVPSVELRLTSGAEANAAEYGSSPKTVSIMPADGVSAPRKYRVVLLCDTPASRERGLQGFRPLKSDEAALFVFQKPEAVTFWMGSVAYPIDIIFVSPGRKVVKIYPNCRPGSLEYYPSTAPVSLVIETAAGSGIRAGDGVSFP